MLWEILGDLLVIGFGAAMATAFLIMALTGRPAFEPNPFILWGEIILCLVTFGIGIWRLIDDARRR